MRPAELEQRIAALAGWAREADAKEAQALVLKDNARAAHWRTLARDHRRRLETLRAELAALRAKHRSPHV